MTKLRQLSWCHAGLSLAKAHPLVVKLGSAGIILLSVVVMIAQLRLPEREFEVASIKPVLARDRGIPSLAGGPGTSTRGHIRYHNVTMSRLLDAAYGLSSDQIIGPRWLIEDQFDLDALLPPGTTADALSAMFQNLLRARFGLETHTSSKEFTIYTLVVAPDGPRFRRSAESAGDGVGDGSSLGDAKWSGKLDEHGCPILLPGSKGMVGDVGRGGCKTYRKTSVRDLIRSLGPMLAIEDGSRIKSPGASAHIEDGTGLKGEFDFNLRYNSAARLRLSFPNAPAFGEEGPSLASALKTQLGLKLESRKGPLPILIVDRIDRTPTAN